MHIVRNLFKSDEEELYFVLSVLRYGYTVQIAGERNHPKLENIIRGDPLTLFDAAAEYGITDESLLSIITRLASFAEKMSKS